MREIEPGERVWSYNFQSGTWQLCEVAYRHDDEYEGPMITLDVSVGEVTATAYHPFWVVRGKDLESRPKPGHVEIHEDRGGAIEGRWVNSHDVQVGDEVFLRGHGVLEVKRVSQRQEKTAVCNLTILGLHTFAVGKAQVLVHNTSASTIAALETELSTLTRQRLALQELPVGSDPAPVLRVQQRIAAIEAELTELRAAVAANPGGLGRFPEWRRGNSITQLMPDGSYPSWQTIRSRYWQNRAAAAAPGEFSASNLGAMNNGFPPSARVVVRMNATGEIRTIRVVEELHHARGGRGVQGFDTPVDLREVWPWEHAAIDHSRRLDYTFIRFASGN